MYSKRGAPGRCAGATFNERPLDPIALRVKKSAIPGAGYGLYVQAPKKFERERRNAHEHMTRDGHKLVFFAGENVAVYIGKLLNAEQLEQLYPGDALAAYVVHLRNTNEYLDAADWRHGGVARYANDCHGTPRECNATLVEDDRRLRIVYLQATRAIYDGDEVLVNYGTNYWSR